MNISSVMLLQSTAEVFAVNFFPSPVPCPSIAAEVHALALWEVWEASFFFGSCCFHGDASRWWCRTSTLCFCFLRSAHLPLCLSLSPLQEPALSLKQEAAEQMRLVVLVDNCRIKIKGNVRLDKASTSGFDCNLYHNFFPLLVWILDCLIGYTEEMWAEVVSNEVNILKGHYVAFWIILSTLKMLFMVKFVQ